MSAPATERTFARVQVRSTLDPLLENLSSTCADDTDLSQRLQTLFKVRVSGVTRSLGPFRRERGAAIQETASVLISEQGEILNHRLI